MKKLIYVMLITGIIGTNLMTVNAREVTTLEAEYAVVVDDTDDDSIEEEIIDETETDDVIDIVDITDETDVTETDEADSKSTFTGNYGSSDEDEWIDMDAEDCPCHIWDYSYDDDEDSIGEDGDIIYFRYCLNCGYTECLDECPAELEYTLSDYVDDNTDDFDIIDSDIIDEDITEEDVIEEVE